MTAHCITYHTCCNGHANNTINDGEDRPVWCIYKNWCILKKYEGGNLVQYDVAIERKTIDQHHYNLMYAATCRIGVTSFELSSRSCVQRSRWVIWFEMEWARMTDAMATTAFTAWWWSATVCAFASQRITLQSLATPELVLQQMTGTSHYHNMSMMVETSHTKNRRENGKTPHSTPRSSMAIVRTVHHSSWHAPESHVNQDAGKGSLWVCQAPC